MSIMSHFSSVLALGVLSLAMQTGACADELKVSVTRSSNSNASPEINFVIENNSDLKQKVVFTAQKSFTGTECERVMPVPGDEESQKASQRATKHLFHKFDRDSFGYYMELDPRAMTASSISLDVGNGVTILPCTIEYRISDLKGNVFSSGQVRMTDVSPAPHHEPDIQAGDIKVFHGIQKNLFTSHLTVATILRNDGDGQGAYSVSGKEIVGCRGRIKDVAYIRPGMEGSNVTLAPKSFAVFYSSLSMDKRGMGAKNEKCEMTFNLVDKSDNTKIIKRISVPLKSTGIYKDARFFPMTVQ